MLLRVASLICLTLLLAVNGCVQASLKQGNSTASYRGMKIFSPTTLSLSDGDKTETMTVNGVDIPALVHTLETAVLAGIAAG